MKKQIWNKKIPTFMGFFVLLFITGITISFLQTGTIIPILATQSAEPISVKISNVSDTSFTVSYTTADPHIGTISYATGTDNTDITLDVRDSQQPSPHYFHYIQVNNLQPKTQYSFTINSGGNTYDNNGTPYTLTTGETLTPPPPNLTIKGDVVMPDGTNPQEGAVFVKTENSQILSTLLQANGSYSLDLYSLRNASLNSFMAITDNTPLTITVSGDSGQSEITTIFGNANPIPTITLSQNYDFQIEETSEFSTDEASSEAEIEPEPAFPSFTSTDEIQTEPQILTPQKDEAFKDSQPRFSGTALPNGTVEIIINSSHQIKATIKTDKNGNWTYRPPKALEPGKHTIQIITRDEAGIVRTITQSFIVNAQGSQFTEPSVITPTPSPTVMLTPTTVPISTAPTLSPTPSPTLTPTIATVSHSQIPTPTTAFVTLQPTTPLQPLPSEKPGSEDIIITLALAGFAIIAGCILFFFTMGGM